MTSSDLLFYIRKMVPEVDIFNYENRQIANLHLSYETKVARILSNHFAQKKSRYVGVSVTNVLNTEAKYINKLFPSLTRAYIVEQLDMFRDFHNRKEIVLRIILRSYVSNSVPSPPKRANSNGQLVNDNSNDEPTIKHRKTFQSGPAQYDGEINFRTENMFSIRKPCTVTSTITSTVTSSFTENPVPNEPQENVFIPTDLETYNGEIPVGSNEVVADTTSAAVSLNLGDALTNVFNLGKPAEVLNHDVNQFQQPTDFLDVSNEGDSQRSDETVFYSPDVQYSEENSEFRTPVASIIKKNEPPKIDYKVQMLSPVALKIRKIDLQTQDEVDFNRKLRDQADNAISQIISTLSARSEDGPDNGSRLDEEPVSNANEKCIVDADKFTMPKAEKPKEKFDTQLVSHLSNIFSDACPRYIRSLCRGKTMSNEVLDDLITIILQANNKYPKRQQEPEVVPENQFEILKEVLPDVDPDYLQMKCDQFEGKPELVKAFINECMEKGGYPTIKDYQRRQQLSAQQKQYTVEFTVENFIKVIPDPEAFFSDPTRVVKLDPTSAHYALIFLRNTFNRIPLKTIQSIFTQCSSNLTKSIKFLKKLMSKEEGLMKSARRRVELPKNIDNIPLLQEIAYWAHEEEISNYIKHLKKKEETEKIEAKNNGLLRTCNCCYDDEVLPRDIYTCEGKCEFCKSCIVKSVEVLFGEGKLEFPCLMNCSSSFSLQTLQATLSPKLFSKIAQKKALEEVKAAGIEELETCPFCDFATIPAEGYNIFTCMNPDCMKESCRMCKEPSHVPLRCDEIEKDEDVKARVFVENQMTEALLRKCYKCGIKFFKEEGCNKMTCSCGAQMCYVCGQPVTNYKHFNGNGGDRFDLCPLYSDTNVLNKENVLRGAEQAKAQLGNATLKNDPTKDVAQYFEERKTKFPHHHVLVGQLAPGQHNLQVRQMLNLYGNVFELP